MIAYLIAHTPLRYFVQSFWRDEAFSVLVAQKPLAFFFGKLTFEPPLYYTLLHFWVQIFGTSEVATRSLSLLGVTLATVIVVFWAEKLFEKHWLSWFLPATFLFNPMILYYAFEVRAYGWYIFFATLTMYAYWQKRWALYTISAALAFYTHTYAIFIPFVTALHYIWFHKASFLPKKIVQRPERFMAEPIVRSSISYFLLITPWLVMILRQLGSLRQSWFYPVDLQLVRSVLGNMFTGYEGTPWYGWKYMTLLSVILFVTFVYALKDKKNRERNWYFGMMTFIPLIIVIGISFIKPLFVNRYLIFASISEIFLLSFALERIHNSLYKKIAALGIVAFLVGFNLWFPSQRPKVNIRRTVEEVNALVKHDDLIYAQSPLVLFETLYYAYDTEKVRLYNPQNNPFPWYVGDIIFNPEYNTQTLPVYPSRAFFIHEDGSYSIEYQMPATYAPGSVLKAKSR